MIQPTAPERIQQVQDALLAEFRGTGEHPALANTQNTLALGDATHLEFHGRLYRVPPVPYRAGAQLQELMDLTRRAGRDWKARDQLNGRAAQLFFQLVRPVSRWRRLLWPAVGNPFRQASEEEIQELYLFFFACRTKSTVRSHFATGPGSRSP